MIWVGRSLERDQVLVNVVEEGILGPDESYGILMTALEALDLARELLRAATEVLSFTTSERKG